MIRYLAAKLVAMSALTSASTPLVVAWCTVEFWAFVVARYFAEEGNWLGHIAGMDNPIVTLLLCLSNYLSMLAAPIPL